MKNNIKNKYICFTLDVEEDHAGLLQNHYEGIQHLEEIIQIAINNNITLSFFTQAKIIENFPEKIELIRESNFEIHLHSYNHNLRKIKNLKEDREDIERSREIFHDFFGKYPIGYRFPLGVLDGREFKILNELEFKFDSSIFPTLRPKYFNNLNMPLMPFEILGIIEIPFSVISKSLRIPIALSFMKLLYPLHFLKIYDNSILIFDFHLHDLFKLKSTRNLKRIHQLPYIRNSEKGIEILLKFQKKLLREGYKSIGIYEMYKKIKNV